MRALLAVIGAVSVIVGIAVAAEQIRLITDNASLPLSLLGAALAILVAASGAYIVRGAIRGRIAVRRTGARRKSRLER
jgi:hypothetical protein